MAGPPVHWVYRSRLLPHLSYKNKIMDDSSEEDERLNASKIEVREILRMLDQANLENMIPIWDDGRIIVEEGHIALKDEMKFATRKYRAPYGLEQVEMGQERKELDAAGSLYVALTDYKKQDPATPSPLSLGTPGDKRSGPVEDRFRKILERGEPSQKKKAWMRLSARQERKWRWGILKDLSGDDCADTATPPLTSSPRKNLELPLTSETSIIGMILLSTEESKKSTFD